MAKAGKTLVLGLYIVVLLICFVGINGFIEAVRAKPDGNWLRSDYVANSFIPMAVVSGLALWFQLRRRIDWSLVAGFIVVGVLLFMSVVNHALPERAAPFAIAHIIVTIAVVLLIGFRLRSASASAH